MKTMTLAEVLELPPETSEQAYRRGYKDGFIAALQAQYDEQPVPDALWNFWHEILHEWENGAEREDAGAFEPPPMFGADLQ